MDSHTRQFVRQRADDHCEYRHLPQWTSEARFHIEPIPARRHGGSDHIDNLTLACDLCNRHKGADLAALDPLTRALVPRFHPHRDAWSEHFQLSAEWVEGLTPVGRATVQLLQMNEPRRRALRLLVGSE